MDIVTAVKLVPDDQDIQVNGDRSLNFSKARPVVSTYDLNAVEAGAQAAAGAAVKHYVVSVADEAMVDSKVNKNILARGVDELILANDAAFADLDAFSTATALAEVVKRLDNVGVVVCGDGSADVYAQQVDVQLAERLGWPVVTAVIGFEMDGASLVATRLLETEKEKVSVALPVVISVVPDIAVPRICGMKDILSAGKKPIIRYGADDLGVELVKGVNFDQPLAPIPATRKQEIYEANAEGIAKFAAALKEAIR